MLATLLQNEVKKYMTNLVRRIKLLSLAKGVGIGLFLLLLAACSETNEENDEFAAWQTQNDTYYEQVYQTAQSAIAAGDGSWKIIRQWSLPAAYTPSATQCVVAHVITAGSGTTCPLYSDTTHVSYVGRLIPSASYPTGYEFERTYRGEFNAATVIPVKLGVSKTYVSSSSGSISESSNIEGMTTVLQQMHVGDRWEVYMPYAMAYGASDQGSVPAYSTLIFDLYLHDYWHAGATERK